VYGLLVDFLLVKFLLHVDRPKAPWQRICVLVGPDDVWGPMTHIHMCSAFPSHTRFKGSTHCASSFLLMLKIQ
jgi:hypothetical protein